MIKRVFDIVFSLMGIVFVFPFFIFFSILIIADSGFPVLFTQKRVGKDFIDFCLLKFRTMHVDSDKKGLLTIGSQDARITRSGYFLRKYKLDELPQLINVLSGTMSLVGPRPEVRKYVEMYTTEQRAVLSVKPGISDYASIEYSNENDILSKSGNPEQLYIDEIMPAKLKLNLKYIRERNILTDVRIILKTIKKVLS
jgi:lipopolysaccharide/colanic/teichoic acid biosynthesis glycosyltransferase